MNSNKKNLPASVDLFDLVNTTGPQDQLFKSSLNRNTALAGLRIKNKNKINFTVKLMNQPVR